MSLQQQAKQRHKVNTSNVSYEKAAKLEYFVMTRTKEKIMHERIKNRINLKKTPTTVRSRIVFVPLRKVRARREGHAKLESFQLCHRGVKFGLFYLDKDICGGCSRIRRRGK